MTTLPSDCSCRPTSKASLSLEELLERQARYYSTQCVIHTASLKMEAAIEMWDLKGQCHVERQRKLLEGSIFKKIK